MRKILTANLFVLAVFLTAVNFYSLGSRPSQEIKVLSSTVANLQTVSALINNIEFQFSRPVNRGLISQTISLTPSVLGTEIWKNDQNLVLQFDENLDENQTYELQFAVGNIPPLPFFPTIAPEVINLQFKTGEAPKIMSTIPLDHDTNVPINKSLTFEFNQNIAVDDFKKYFFMKPWIEGNFEAIDKKIIFAPGSPLAKNTNYFAGVLKGLPGENKQQMTQDFFLNFQTEGTGPLLPTAARSVKIPILMYHNIGEWQPYESSFCKRFKIEPENLQDHLKYISDNYTPIFLEDLYGYLAKGEGLPEKPIILTFDDGWQGVYKYAYPILKKYHLKFTLFLITSHYENKSAYLSKKEIKEMAASNLAELGNHSVHHPMLAFYNKTQIEQEINEANQQIEKDFGVKAKAFAYPGGSYNKIVLDVLEEQNFHTAVTINAGTTQGENELFLLKRIGIDGEDTVEMLKQRIGTANQIKM